MDLSRIRYFLELSSSLNFSEAARQLGISQPALTKAVARLEMEVGGKLVRREGKHTHLTAIGVAMRERFAEIDSSVKRAELVAHRYTRQSLAQLRIGVSAGVGPLRAAQFLAEFVKRYPETEINLQDVPSNDLQESMLSGVVDCGFIASEGRDHAYISDQRLHVLDLYREPLVLISPKRPVEDAPQCRKAATPRLGRVAWGSGNHAEDMGSSTECVDDLEFPVNGTPKVSSTRDDWTQALVLAGLGSAIVPRDSVISSRLRADKSVSVGDRMVSLVIPTGRIDTIAVQRFLEMARQFVW